MRITKIAVILVFIGLALWGCDTTTGCLGDFANKTHVQPYFPACH